MAIAIHYPPVAQNNRSTVVEQRFIAYGTKVGAEVPLGVLVPARNGNSTDPRCLIGGRTLPLPPAFNTKWIIAFDVPKVVRGFYKLAVFDAAALPVGPLNAPAADIRTVQLRVKRDAKKKLHAGQKRREAKSASLINFNPENIIGHTDIMADFVAYGSLPEGAEDLNVTGAIRTRVVSCVNSANIQDPLFTSVDDNGFWVAYFGTLGAGYELVDLKIAYTPSGEEEESDIELT